MQFYFTAFITNSMLLNVIHAQRHSRLAEIEFKKFLLHTKKAGSKWINIYRETLKKEIKNKQTKIEQNTSKFFTINFFYSRYFSVLFCLNPRLIIHNQLVCNNCGRCLAISIHLTSIVLIPTKSATVAQLFWQPRAGEPWRNGAICVAQGVELTVSKTERNEKRQK